MSINVITNSIYKSSSYKDAESKDLQLILAGIQQEMQNQNKSSTNRYKDFNKHLSGINEEEIIKYRPRYQSFFYSVMLAFRCGKEYKKEEYILDRLGQLDIKQNQTKSFLQLQTIIVKYLLKKSTKQYLKYVNQSQPKYLKNTGYLKVLQYLHKSPRKQIQRILQKRQSIIQEINKKMDLNKLDKIYIISTQWLKNLQTFLNTRKMNDFPGIITHFQIIYLCFQSKNPKLLSSKEVSYISESLWKLISKNLAFMQIQLYQKKYLINYSSFNPQKQFQQRKPQQSISEEINTQLSHSQVSFLDRPFFKGISKNQEQLYIKKSSKQKIQLTRRGIRNLGNTCFMNAPLQCLRSCEVWSFTEQQINKSRFIKQLHKIMKPQLSTEQKLQPFQPYQLKDLISKYNPQFKGNSQHDSSAFLISLLQLIDQETAVVKDQVPLNRQNIIDDYDLLNRYKLKEKGISRSFINDYFLSRYLVAYRCNQCKSYNNKLMQTQKILNVPIPFNIKKINIQQCLEQFQKSQIIQWKCKNCKIYTEHTKSMQLIQLNKILIIWLKRFQDNNKCQLPLEQCYQLNFPSKDYKFDFVYELFGIVNHSGGLKSGHYTAYCDSGLNEQWWSYNDARVTKVSSRDRQQMFKDAVMLFYRYVGKDKTFNEIVKNK